MARRCSEVLNELLFEPLDRQRIGDDLKRSESIRVTIRAKAGEQGDPGDVASALSLPWELLSPAEAGEFPVRSGQVQIVREAQIEGAPGLNRPSKPATVAVMVAAPTDSARFPYEAECLRLLDALAPLGQRAVYSNLGTVEDLIELVEDVEAQIIHFRGYAEPGCLTFENELGFAQRVSVTELCRRLASILLAPGRGGSFPALFFLSSPFGADLGDKMATASALHQSGFAEVVSYFGPVHDELQTRLEERFYRGLAEGLSTLESVGCARSALIEPVGQEGARGHYPFGWSRLAVFHRGPDRPVGVPIRSRHESLSFRRKIEVSGLPMLERGFVGRRGSQHEVRRRVELEGQRLIVIQGLGGFGKTALATQLLAKAFAPEAADQLVLHCTERARNPIRDLLAQAENHGTAHELPAWSSRIEDLRKRFPDPSDGLVATLRSIRVDHPGLVIYLDNAEAFQDGPRDSETSEVGSWKSSFDPCWKEIESLATVDGCLVLVTTRYTWDDMPHRAHIPLPPLGLADTLRLLETFEALGRLPREILGKLAQRVDGHPRTVEFLDRLIAEIGSEADRSVAEWQLHLETVFPKGDEKIRGDLILEALWQRLPEQARQHARALRVLRRPAPVQIVDVMGEGRDSLVRAGWLTRFRIRARARGGTRMINRWGLHSLVRSHLSQKGRGPSLPLDRIRAADAWKAWVEGSDWLWEDLEQAVFHLHDLGQGNRAWPCTERYYIWLRSQARYTEAAEIALRARENGTTGDRLAMSLLFEAQAKRLAGDRTGRLVELVAEAEAYAENEETRIRIRREKATVALELGDFAGADGLLSSLLADLEDAGGESETLASTLHELAEVQARQGRYRKAEEAHRRALEIRRECSGKESPAYLGSLFALATTYTRQDRFAAAEPLLRECLEIEEETRGSHHPVLASTLHELGVALSAQGKLLEAESRHQLSLEIFEQTLGSDHPDTAASLHELARVVSDQGKYDQAVEILRKNVVRVEQSYGATHPSYAVGLAELGSALSRSGRSEEAESLFESCIGILESALGSGHPEVAVAMQNLAFAVESLGRYDESAALLERALAIIDQSEDFNRLTHARLQHARGRILERLGSYEESESILRAALAELEAVLGEDHHEHATVQHEIASVLERQGRYEEAEELLRESLENKTASLGTEHPSTLTTLQELANVLGRQGQISEAEHLLRESLPKLEEAIGAEHPDFGAVLYALAGVLELRGAFSESEQLHRRYLSLLEEKGWTDHSVYGTALRALSGVLAKQGRLEEADDLASRSIELISRTLGESHPDYAISLHEQSSILLARGCLDEAEATLRKALDIKAETLGKTHPSYGATCHQLGVVLKGLGRLSEALECLEISASVSESVLGADHPNYASTLHALAGIYSALKDYDEAEKLLEKSIEIKARTLGPSHPTVFASLHNLANVWVGQGHPRSAEALLMRAVDLAREQADERGPEIARSLGLLAQVRALLGQEEAASTAREALVTFDRVLGPDHPQSQSFRKLLAPILYPSDGSHDQAG